MKSKVAYFLYGGYVVLLLGLLGGRFVGKITSDVLEFICLGIFCVLLLFCCGGYVGFPNHHFESEDLIKQKLESRNDPLLIKEFLIMLLPVIIIFMINYLYSR